MDAISSVRSFLNLSGRTIDEVRKEATKKDKLTHIVNTLEAHPIEDRHNVVLSSTTNYDTSPREVSQTESLKTDGFKNIASHVSLYLEVQIKMSLQNFLIWEVQFCFPLEEPLYETQNLIGITHEQRV